jgi:hypothetical protein
MPYDPETSWPGSRVNCPSCGAAPGEPCHGINDGPPDPKQTWPSIHGERLFVDLNDDGTENHERLELLARLHGQPVDD